MHETKMKPAARWSSHSNNNSHNRNHNKGKTRSG